VGIILVVIGGYYFSGYGWLFVVIILMLIGGYFVLSH